MEHFGIKPNEKLLQVVNVTMENEITDEKEHVVMITDPDIGETFLTGEVLFEAQFENVVDSQLFYELMRKAKIVQVG